MGGYSLPPETNPSFYKAGEIHRRLDQDFEGDVEDFDALMAAFLAFEPEYVLHLAAQSLVQKSFESPARTFRTNISGTVNVLEVARRNKVKGVVAVTTDKVYDNSIGEIAFREEHGLWGVDPYSASKVGAELTIASYQQLAKADDSTKIVAVRGGNIIGGGDWSENRIVPDAIRAWRQSRPLLVRNPHHVRPWQHVVELVDSYLRILSRMTENVGIPSPAYNVGPAHSSNKSVSEVATIISSLLGSSWTQDQSQRLPRENPILLLDSTKISREIDWRPVWDTEEALEMTVEWYQKFYSGAEPANLSLAQLKKWEERRGT